MKENIKLCFYLLLCHSQGLSIISKMGITPPAAQGHHEDG